MKGNTNNIIEFYYQFFGKFSYFVFILNDRLEVEWVNSSVTDFLDTPEDKFIGKSIDSILKDPNRSSVIFSLDSFKQGNTKSLTAVLAHGSSNVALDYDIFNLSSFNEKLSGIVLISRKIPQKKKVLIEQKLPTSAFNTLFNFAHEGIAVVDSEENLTFTNTSFASMLGYSRADLEGENLIKILTDDQYNKVLNETKKRAKGESSKYDVKMIKKSGNTINVILSVSPMFDKRGEYTGAVGIVTDISREVRLTRKLSEANKRLKLLYEVIDLTYRYELINMMLEAILNKILHHTSFTLGGIFLRDVTQKSTIAVITKGLDQDSIINLKNADLNFDSEGIQTISLSNGSKLINIALRSENLFFGFLSLGVLNEKTDISGFEGFFISLGQEIAGGIMRLRYRKDLKESVSRYKKLFEQSSVTILITNKDFDILECNRPALRFFKLQRSELIKRNFKEFIKEKMVLDRISSQLSSDNIVDNLEHELALEDGSSRYVWNSIHPLMGDQNQLLGYQVILYDRTEVYQHSSKLHELNLMLQSLNEIADKLNSDIEFKEKIESVTEMIVKMLNCDSAILFVHDDYKGIMDVKREYKFYDDKKSSITYSLVSFFPKISSTLLKKSINRKIDTFSLHDAAKFSLAAKVHDFGTGLPYPINKTNFKKHGFKKLTVFPLPGESGKTVGLLLLMKKEDIERESLDIFKSIAELLGRAIVSFKQEAEIEEAYLRYKYLYEFAMAGIYRTEIKTGEFLSANQTMAELFLCKNETELRERCNAKEMVRGKAREEFIATLRKHGSVKGYELSITREDGLEMILLINARIFEKEGYIEGTVTDVTKLKKLEEELKKKNEEMESFVYSVSHDLKSPLYTIGGYTSLLESEQIEKSKKKEFIEKIKNNTKEMSSFISKLLELSRAGRIVGNISNQPIKSFVEDLVNDININYPDVEFKLKNLPKSINAGYRIKEVFQNLISNAVESLENSEKQVVEISCKELSQSWRFLIKDTGKGISEANLNKIFNPGYSSKVRKSTVNGFGLSITQKIIEAHDGTISIESVKDKGTTVTFSILKSQLVEPSID